MVSQVTNIRVRLLQSKSSMAYGPVPQRIGAVLVVTCSVINWDTCAFDSWSRDVRQQRTNDEKSSCEPNHSLKFLSWEKNICPAHKAKDEFGSGTGQAVPSCGGYIAAHSAAALVSAH